jgi:hypothetical protein
MGEDELDKVIDIYYDKVDIMAFLDKIQFNFDNIMRHVVDAVSLKFPNEQEIPSIADYYSDVVFNLMENCKDFLSMYEDDEQISARRIIQLFNTVQVDLVSINEEPRKMPEYELVKPNLETDVRALVLEIALRVIDEDMEIITSMSRERLHDFITLEVERRKLKDEGVI